MSNAKVSNELQQRLECHKPLCRTTLYKHAQTAVLGIYHPTSQHQMLNAGNPVSEDKPLVQSPKEHLKRHAWVSNTLMLTAVWTKPSIIPALMLTSVLTPSHWGMDLPQSWHLTLISSALWVMMMSWCLMSSDVIWHIRDKLWPMPKHGSIKSTYVRCMRV